MSHIPAKDLDIENHVQWYRSLGHISGNEANDAFFIAEAEHLHALACTDAILHIHFDSISTAHQLENVQARSHLLFGAGRRAKAIWLSLRTLLSTCDPKRDTPLNGDSAEEVSRDLNVAYINIRGTLDNFSWCLLELFGTDEARTQAARTPMKVSLFSPKFYDLIQIPDLAQKLAPFAEWNDELKQRRDPAAHRIPLSVIPSIQDSTTKPEFDRLHAEWLKKREEAFKAVASGEKSDHLFEAASLANDALERVGNFRPLFAHNPNDGWMKIYPTVPQDVGRLVLISRILLEHIADGSRAKR